MRVLRGCFWTLCLLGLVLPFGMQGQLPEAPVKTSKIIVYPKKGESISQLKQRGIQKIDNYGSYWVVRATDAQSKEIDRTFGDRAVKANHLNYIELDAVRLDTTAGEPAIPGNLQGIDTGGERLRLIQFKGPVKPDWLEQVKAAGNLKVVSYIPNNAYVVWLDGDAEQKLQSLLDPQGPLQWIGHYHPYYKIQRSLLTAEPGKEGATMTVRVAVVAHSDSEMSQTANMIQALGVVQSSYELAGQKIFQVDVPQSAVSQIAQLPDVLWIEKVMPKRLLDEVQNLILAGQTNGLPQHAPSPTSSITDYLSFLINTVGGGMASFQNSSTYPVVDIADTGLDNGTFSPGHPAFYYLGNPSSWSRIAYLSPQWLFGDPLTQLGCTTRLNENDFRYLEASDVNGHGTRVASVVAGYDTTPTRINQCVMPSICPTLLSSSDYSCPGSGSGTITVQVTFTCPDSSTQVLPETVLFSDCGIPLSDTVLCPCTVTRTFTETRTDPSGFQLGLGVSPFGLIGINRIFSQDLTVGVVNNVCTITTNEPGRCMNNLPALVAMAYVAGARIQNNSWADIIDIQGLNGGMYTADSQTYDTAVRDALLVGSPNTPGPSPLNQEFIVVFACNSGLGDAGSEGNAGGFGDIRVTAPSTAKNVISVGSSENARQDLGWCGYSNDSFDIWPSSAVGPTLDGRFKPEIVAPGASVYGAYSQLLLAMNPTNQCGTGSLSPTNAIMNCIDPIFGFPTRISTNILYTCHSGSSYAAPAVSGGIQLLWWYFQNRLTNEVGQALLQPSPAMAKAYLLNSARYLPVTNPQTGAKDTLPSTAQGMGMMDLARMFDGVGRVIRDESAPRAIDIPLTTTNPAPQQTYFSQSGQSYEVSGQVLSNGLPFRVTLAWTDAAGNPAAFQQLVDDLDLDVTIGGQTYKGNIFTEDHSVPGGAYDGVNNTESVFLPAGGVVTSGAPYTVVVRATTIAADGVPNVGSSLDQDFALVVYNSQNPSDVPNLATNNSCATAMVITNTPFSFTNTLSKAVYGNAHPSPSAARGGVDEFFKINLPTPGGVLTIDTTGSSFDNVLSVWQVRVVPQTVFVRGGCGALVEVTSTNGGLSSVLSFTADGSNDYYIVVEPHNDGPGGTLVLNVRATAPAISVTPSLIQFAAQMVGSTGAMQTVTYQNNTTVNIGISSVSIAGAGSNDFVIESQSCAGGVVATGKNCSVSIAFAPTTNGLRTAQLVINDDATGSPRIVPLSGNGLPAMPLACLSSSSLVFGNQPLGTTNFQTVAVTNCGSAPLVISSMTLTGPGSSDFITNSISCAPFPATNMPGVVCTINIGFVATNGSFSATLSIVDNASGSPHQVDLTGTGCATITLAPLTVTNATTGAAYDQSITASNGVAPYSYAFTSGIFPPGLTLLSSGAFSGASTMSGIFTFTVTAVDVNGCSGSQQYTIQVSCPVLGLTSLTLTNALVGVPYNQTITVTNGVPPITFARTGGALPSGLTLTSAGTITGTPVAPPRSFSFTVTATDANGCQGSRSYTISVGCPTITLSPTNLPGGTLGQFYSQTITAGGGASPYSFATSGSLPPGLSLAATGLLSGIPTARGTFTFTVTATDANGCTGSAVRVISISCQALTLLPLTFPNVTIGTPYNQSNSLVGGTAPLTFASSVPLPPGLTYSTNGVLSGTPTTVGMYNFTITGTDANDCSTNRAYTVSVTCGTLTLVPQTLPDAVLGAIYNQTITASGRAGAFNFVQTAGSLPPGITLTSSGVLTGTPTALGSSTFKVTASDPINNSCSSERWYTLSVTCPTITVSPSTLPSGQIGTPYSQTNLTASGGAAPYTFIQTGGSLPSGMSLSNLGTLSGTPLSGSSVFTVTATDANGCQGSQSYTITINPADPAPPTTTAPPITTALPITIDPPSLGPATKGQHYSQLLTASGGTSSLTFTRSSGSLPTGVTLSGSGVISGTPAANGTFNFTVTASDTGGHAGNRAYTLSVYTLSASCPTITVTPGTLPTGTVSSAYNRALIASGGAGPYSFAVTAGVLPGALALSDAGTLSGTPSGAGQFNFTVTATDTNNCQGSQAYSLVVSNPPAGSAAPDLRVSITAYPTNVYVLDSVTYTVVVTNAGPSTATGVTLTNTLPAGAELVSAGTSPGYSQLVGAVSYSLGTLLSGDSAQATIVVAPLKAGVLTNSATVAANESDPNMANNSAGNNAVSVLAAADVDLTGIGKGAKQTGKQSAKSTYSVTAKLTCRNQGRETSQAVVKVRFYLSSSSSLGSDKVVLGKDLSAGRLKAGQSRQMTFRAKLPVGENASGQYVIAVIDPDHLVAESDKTNNTIVVGQVP